MTGPRRTRGLRSSITTLADQAGTWCARDSAESWDRRGRWEATKRSLAASYAV